MNTDLTTILPVLSTLLTWSPTHTLVLKCWLVFGLAGSYLLWPLYIAIMGMKRARDANLLTPFQTGLALPYLFFGLALDFLLNVLFYSVVCLDFSNWKTLSHRLKQYNQTQDPSTLLGRWRLGVCNFFEPILNPYDPSGTHIGNGPV